MAKIIRWKPAYKKIPPEQLDEYFRRGEPVNQTLAELLLSTDRAAVFHVDPERVSTLGKQPYMEPLLLGANYSGGAHSEGHHKIIVQNIPERKGPWVLFRPPGSDEHTLYLQDLFMSGVLEPKFEDDVANANKHFGRFYLFGGNPLQIFEDFRNKGFNFVDTPMGKEHYDHLGSLSWRAMRGQ